MGHTLDEEKKRQAADTLFVILREIIWWQAVYGRSNDWLTLLWRAKGEKVWPLLAEAVNSVIDRSPFRENFPPKTVDLPTLINEVLAALYRLTREKNGTRKRSSNLS